MCEDKLFTYEISNDVKGLEVSVVEVTTLVGIHVGGPRISSTHIIVCAWYSKREKYESWT